MFMQNATTFRAAEQVALSLTGLNLAPDACAPGLLAGSLVETEAGWRPVERLMRGMRVATWDGGFSPVARVDRQHLWPAAEVEVIHVPGGALDTCAEFSLLPGQCVFIASAVAEEVLGTGGALVPAAALVGHFGITRRRLFRRAEVLTLRFASEEIVYVNSGALIHCAAGDAEERPASVRPDHFEILGEDRAQSMLALIATGAMTTAGIARAA